MSAEQLGGALQCDEGDVALGWIKQAAASRGRGADNSK